MILDYEMKLLSKKLVEIILISIEKAIKNDCSNGINSKFNTCIYMGIKTRL